MIQRNVLKYFSRNLNIIYYSQYRHLRRAANTVLPRKDLKDEENFLLKQSSELNIQNEQNAIAESSNLYGKDISKLEILDENSLTKTDKQSRELAKYVPKENYIATFNIAAYLNKSETLQQLHKLGVDFSKIEKRKGLGQFVLQLDFERDIKSHLIFMNDIGITPNNFGDILTKNPLIFKERIDDLRTRINYMEAKTFKPTQIQRICTINPFWLMFSTKRIDKRLGYFQQNFKLSGDDIRHLATKQPRLITYNMDHIRENNFCIKEEMGFNSSEIKCLLLSKPKLWMMNHDEIIERFDYVHNVMKLSHEIILHYPEILTSRRHRIKERHEYLKATGKAQYNINEEKFISPRQLVQGTDEEFVKNICETSIEEYETFLRKM